MSGVIDVVGVRREDSASHSERSEESTLYKVQMLFERVTGLYDNREDFSLQQAQGRLFGFAFGRNDTSARLRAVSGVIDVVGARQHETERRRKSFRTK